MGGTASLLCFGYLHRIRGQTMAEVNHMLNDAEMLGSLCQDADIGRSAAQHVLKLVHNNALAGTIQEQLQDYDHAYQSAAQILLESRCKPPKPKSVAKAMTAVSTEMQTMFDPSSSKIAQMMIQGNTMGITTITKQLHQYGEGSEEIVDLARKQVEMEQRNIENLKKFL